MLSSTITAALLVAAPLFLLAALAGALVESQGLAIVMYAASILSALVLAIGAGYGPTALFGWVWVAALGAFWIDALVAGRWAVK